MKPTVMLMVINKAVASIEFLLVPRKILYSLHSVTIIFSQCVVWYVVCVCV